MCRTDITTDSSSFCLVYCAKIIIINENIPLLFFFFTSLLYLSAMKQRLGHILTFLSLFFFCTEQLSSVYAQETARTTDWQTYYDMLLAAADEDEDTENDMQQVFEALSEIASSPINLNAITREELENMMCFDEYQINEILEYISRYGPVKTKSELLMIASLDPARIGLLRTLTYLGEMPPRQTNALDSLKYDESVRNYRRLYDNSVKKGEVVAFARVPFYKRQGDGDAYKGNGIKHWIRADYTFNTRLKVGVLAAEDAGEPFFQGNKNYGYDFYSAYLQLQRLGILRKAVVGRYRIKSGLGLILNNNYSYGKLFSLSSIQSAKVSLRPHSSRTESNYMQGAAVVLRPLRNLELTAFASYKTIDATLTKDSSAIATILKTGYHRTESELNRRHNARQSSFGANIYWANKTFHFGATALTNIYSMPLQPYTEGSGNSSLYRLFNAAGKNFWNVSVDYGFNLGKRIRFAGETATGDCRRIATINTLSWSPNRRLTVTGIQRFYPYRFYATMGKSFSEGGANQNESGVYVGVNWNPNDQLSITGYSDFAYFAWPKYQALGSSHSFDNLLQVTYTATSNASFTARYRLKCREKDGEQEGELIYKNEHRARLTYDGYSGRWNWKTHIDFVCCKYKTTDYGAMVSGQATFAHKALKVSAGTSYFNTSSYNSRVYAYEKSTPYNLSFPSFYGKGVRGYALAEYSLNDRLIFNAKIGVTHYFDRDKIGSSYQTINSPTQTDLDIMLRWRFH